MSDWLLWQICPKIRHILLFYITALIETLQSVDVNLNSVAPLSNQKKKSKHGSRVTEVSLRIVTSLFQVGSLCLAPGLDACQVLPDDLVHCDKTQSKAALEFINATTATLQ